MTDFSPLESALYDATPERIASSLRYLRKADAVMAALMPLAANTQAPPAAAVPEGYALVPVEPTQAMLDAAGMCVVPEGKRWLDASNRETWAAMLAAAPEAPQPAKQSLTDEDIDNTTRKQVDDLLDHIYEYGTAAEGIIERVRAIARAIEQAHGIGEHE